jgi:hypothetical protein
MKKIISYLGILVLIYACIFVVRYMGEPETDYSQGISVYDRTNDNEVVGFNDFVFSGKVVEKIEQKNINNEAYTLFKVQVSDVIKGDVSGTVTVYQNGGYITDATGKRHLILMEDDHLINENKTYIFATRKDESGNYFLNNHYLISDNKNTEKFIERFTKAYKNQILPNDRK